MTQSKAARARAAKRGRENWQIARCMDCPADVRAHNAVQHEEQTGHLVVVTSVAEVVE